MQQLPTLAHPFWRAMAHPSGAPLCPHRRPPRACGGFQQRRPSGTHLWYTPSAGLWHTPSGAAPRQGSGTPTRQGSGTTGAANGLAPLGGQISLGGLVDSQVTDLEETAWGVLPAAHQADTDGERLGATGVQPDPPWAAWQVNLEEAARGLLPTAGWTTRGSTGLADESGRDRMGRVASCSPGWVDCDGIAKSPVRAPLAAEDFADIFQGHIDDVVQDELLPVWHAGPGDLDHDVLPPRVFGAV